MSAATSTATQDNNTVVLTEEEAKIIKIQFTKDNNKAIIEK